MDHAYGATEVELIPQECALCTVRARLLAEGEPLEAKPGT